MYFLGDVHGKWNELIDSFSKYDIRDVNIIQVGDFGIGFNKDNDIQVLNELGNILRERGINMYVIRGNHDDPKYFNIFTSYGNLHLVPDYTYLKIEDMIILLIGGGVSIDRVSRIPNISWWDTEIIKDLPIKNKEVDIVVTHVPIKSFFQQQLTQDLTYWYNKDNILKHSLDNENKLLLKLESVLNYKYWVSGHYHRNFTSYSNNKVYYLLDELSYISLPKY